MAAHNLVRAIVLQRDNQFIVVAANGTVVLMDGEGTVLGNSGAQEDPIAAIVKRKRWGTIIAEYPQPVTVFIESLTINERFPKCFTMLARVTKGGAKIDSFNAREKQALNELIQHGIVRKSKTNYLLA